jgi:hypothetical protein
MVSIARIFQATAKHYVVVAAQNTGGVIVVVFGVDDIWWGVQNKERTNTGFGARIGGYLGATNGTIGNFGAGNGAVLEFGGRDGAVREL